MTKKRQPRATKAKAVPENAGWYSAEAAVDGASVSAIGRPTDYRPEYDELARRLCLIKGFTDAELAVVFDVTETTINNWKIAHPSFLESMNKGKVRADADVAHALHSRAVGYSHPDEVIAINTVTGAVTRAATIKHYPPDTAAAFIWLKNRQGWRDKSTVDVEPGGSLAELLAAAFTPKPTT